MDSPGNFEYERLDRETREIRLIKLVDGESNDVLNLQLKHCSLAEAKSCYSAFSYTWGSSPPKDIILINDKKFLLRENAYRCLRHHRDVEEETIGSWTDSNEVPQTRPQASTWFWTDTICINQDDTKEKDWQVAMMERIFANAQQVLIWLGSHSESNKITQSYLRYLRAERDCQSPQHLGDIVERVRGMWTGKHVRVGAAARLREKESAISVLSPLLQDMLLADYWERLWIVQEVILARSAFIIAGSVRIDFAKMSHLLGPWTTPMDESPALKFVMNLFFDHMTEGKSRPIPDLIETYKSQKCYDRRDRIYGILGLSKDLLGFNVNYQEIPELLFARVIRQLIGGWSRRANHVMKAIPALCQALSITSQSVFHALEDVDWEEARLLRDRDILVEVTCQYVLQSLQCEGVSAKACPGDLSGLYEPGDQHITMATWSDNQPHCFVKRIARPQAVLDVLSQRSSEYTLLCSMTHIQGHLILAVDESGALRIQQCFTHDWKVDPLPRQFMACFQVHNMTACTFGIEVSPCDLVLFYESLNETRRMSGFDVELVDYLLKSGIET